MRATTYSTDSIATSQLHDSRQAVFSSILSHFAKRTKFWLATGSNGPRSVWACFHPPTIARWGLIELG